MFLGREIEEVKRRFGVDPTVFLDREIVDYVLDRYVGHGKIGIVYHATKKDTREEAACKIIPMETLKEDWQIELTKLHKLRRITQVVQCKTYGSVLLPGTKGDKTPYVYIFYEFINGANLREYTKTHPELITLSFVQNLAVQMLHVLHALRATQINHGDLHEGNIMVAEPDSRLIGHASQIVVTDFGIGGSTSRIQPTDDYLQTSLICMNLLRMHIDPSHLEGEDRQFYDRFSNDLLGKQLTEINETVGDYVRNPEKLLENLNEIRENCKLRREPAILRRPFDYLSCEHIGNSFELLQRLYSESFPGYQDLTEGMNTILTGPRGCGKTTIFRNLSFKTRLLGKKTVKEKSLEFLGIYYHCRDLYFAFPYYLPNLTEVAQRIVTHYFNLALLYEILDTLVTAEKNGFEIREQALEQLQGFLRGWFTTYSPPPVGTPILGHLLSLATEEKQKFRAWIDESGISNLPNVPLMPQDFLQRVCDLLQGSIYWLKETPFYFFLDDYSMPRISDNVQAIVNSFIFARYAELFFKVSTESIFTFHPFDASGKLLDETREYHVIDLGDYFLHASTEKKEYFLGEVVNKRLEMAEKFTWKPPNISKILGDSIYKSDNDLARDIQNGIHVQYSGWKTVIDLCSGDIAHNLRLIRDMFNLTDAQPEKKTVPIPHAIQDKAIRETGNEFLNRIEAAPETGPQLRKIAQAFGNVANYYLKSRTSKNVKTQPPMQAFRIEVRETPYFEEGKPEKKYYKDLIKYGVFIRDVRGKSQRGEVVPRLYLRRLLIPTFVLTPSGRDSIGLEVKEFAMLLTDPEKFEKHMKKKQTRKQKELGGRQETLV